MLSLKFVSKVKEIRDTGEKKKDENIKGKIGDCSGLLQIC